MFHVDAAIRADSRFAPSQWKTALLCNDVTHWLGTNLESALFYATAVRLDSDSVVVMYDRNECNHPGKMIISQSLSYMYVIYDR